MSRLVNNALNELSKQKRDMRGFPSHSERYNTLGDEERLAGEVVESQETKFTLDVKQNSPIKPNGWAFGVDLGNMSQSQASQRLDTDGQYVRVEEGQLEL